MYILEAKTQTSKEALTISRSKMSLLKIIVNPNPDGALLFLVAFKVGICNVGALGE